MPREIKLSATRINMFLECKLRYWFNYHDRLPKMTNPSFKLGIVCHETLERAGHIWAEKERFDPEDVEEIMALYNEVSVREGLSEYGIHLQGRDIVRNKLDNFWKNVGSKIVSLEKMFGTNDENEVLTDGGVPLIGAMDLVSEYDQDTLLVVDYKTSNTLPTVDAIKADIQLSIYDLVASIKWPQYKRNILRLDFLKAEPMDTYRTPAERAEFAEYLKELHDQMLALTKRDASPSLNLFCPWCDFKDYCKTYKKAYEKTNYTFEAAEAYRDPDLIDEWTKMRDTKKILETRERELAMVIMQRMKHNEKNLDNGKIELYLRHNSRVDYDVKTVLEHVPKKALAKMVRLNKTQVQNYISNRPGLRDVIEKSASRNYTAPFLATKKIKNKGGK